MYMKFDFFNNIQGLTQNWCSLSQDRLVTPTIGIPTKCMYSVVHYLSKKRSQMSVCQIDLELQLVLWKQLRTPFSENKRWKKKRTKKMEGAFNTRKHGKRNAGCTLSLREPKTRQERECRWKHSPRLGRSRVASLALTFLVVCGVRINESRILAGYRLWFLIVFLKSAFPSGLRARSNSVKSYTRIASSWVTLARESCRTKALGESVQPA